MNKLSMVATNASDLWRATPCEDCEHVHPATRKERPHNWMCMRFPRLPGLDAVAPTQRAVMDPWNRCANINLGFCPVFQPRRVPPTDPAAEGSP